MINAADVVRQIAMMRNFHKDCEGCPVEELCDASEALLTRVEELSAHKMWTRTYAAEAKAAALEAAMREIAGVATDLPHARRIDRDRMREIARAALGEDKT